ncbi:unnamed protein product [Rotaria socialis]|nr:unnamed protein product [Rotaria socialis]
MHYSFCFFVFNVLWTTTIVHGQVNPCVSNPCKNGATCQNINSVEYNCICPPQFPVEGKNCDQLITTTTTTVQPIVTPAPSPCASSPCLNSGTCILQAVFNDPYRCACTQYTYGARCENINRCFTGVTPCLNSGICVPGVNGAYTCACTPQYTGSTCEILVQPISICASQPCANGGTCLSLNNNAAFFCNCPPGYSGSRCEFANPCINAPCYNDGTCVAINTGGYECICRATFTGPRCETPNSVDVCSPSPCKNGALCLTINGAYYCNCPPSYTGQTCEQIIMNNNVCITSPNLCQNGGTCISTGGNGWTCQCPAGYTGVNCATPNFANTCLQNNPQCLNGGT